MVPGALIVIGSRLQFEIHYPLIGIQIVGVLLLIFTGFLGQGLGDAGLVADHQQRVAPVPPVGVVCTKGAASIGSVGLLDIPDRAVDIGACVSTCREAAELGGRIRPVGNAIQRHSRSLKHGLRPDPGSGSKHIGIPRQIHVVTNFCRNRPIVIRISCIQWSRALEAIEQSHALMASRDLMDGVVENQSILISMLEFPVACPIRSVWFRCIENRHRRLRTIDQLRPYLSTGQLNGTGVKFRQVGAPVEDIVLLVSCSIRKACL